MVRYAVAIVLAGVALGFAVYLGSLRLHTYTLHSRNCAGLGLPLGMTCGQNHRAPWQLPVAAVIAGLGLVVAVGAFKRI